MLKVAVCVKLVDGDINPFDACALEEALKLENAEITLVSMGPESWKEPLLKLTRLGVKKVLLLSSASFAGADTLATGYTLSLALKAIKPDLIFCGRQSIDGDTAQVGPELSAVLEFSLLANVMEICAVDEQTITCKTRIGEQTERLPALLTIERINTLRFPKLRSKVTEVTLLNETDLQADLSRCGLKGSPTRVLQSFHSERGRRTCVFALPEQFGEILSKLKSASAKENQFVPSEKKLDQVCIVGDILRDVALSIAKDCVVIPQADPDTLCQRISSGGYHTVLWPANLWGRAVAPIVAAKLQTGLCADCTDLETDGERLIMYRPAKGGSVMAKIVCQTLPQMATVRYSQNSRDIFVSGGMGVADCYDRVLALAKKLNGEVGASRRLVDAGIAPYEAQIGLTGKNVSPSVYIAIGISGAIQHTCAIENAKTIIAVNSDKNARIFDYADYGFVCDFKQLNF